MKLVLLFFFFLLVGTSLGQDLQTIKLTKHNFVTVKGQITQSTASKFVDDIYKIEGDTIYIFLTTPGGSVIDGYDMIQNIHSLVSAGKDVICIGDVAASMGFVIMQACPTRYVRPASIMMQHQMSLGLDGPIEHVNSRLSFIQSIKDKLEIMEATRLGLTLEEFHNKIVSDWWLFGEDIVEANAADQVVHVFCDFDYKDVTNIQRIHTFLGPVNVEFSGCPLVKEYIKVLFDDSMDQSNHDLITNEVNKHIESQKLDLFK